MNGHSTGSRNTRCSQLLGVLSLTTDVVHLDDIFLKPAEDRMESRMQCLSNGFKVKQIRAGIKVTSTWVSISPGIQVLATLDHCQSEKDHACVFHGCNCGRKDYDPRAR
ncbi:hypothetical protein NDN08_005824 [Rhodosorus marinus]|uniref:Uncharacterized protein n=1 Tax=Rhodosorus marinus TaxID=101924 RepID=A0AAV8V3C4_9RHOD|nr:hypothetical protein NDN08_005824 [Rhodosorus marinus]